MALKVSVVIPVFPYDKETREITERAISEWQRTSTELVKLEILPIEGARPFAENVNIGLNKAKGEFLVVANNDAVPLEGWDRSVLTRLDGKAGVMAFTPRSDCGWMFGVTRQVMEEVGVLDERLVNSFEDVDYFLRVALSGRGRSLAEGTYAVHEGGFTVNKLWGGLLDSTRLAQCLANRDYMLSKWVGIDVAKVCTQTWASKEVEIMKEWASGRVS